MRKCFGILGVCMISATASAQPYPVANPTGYDPYAADAIERADYASAEDRLLRRLEDNDADTSALLNLAAVMSETDRVARASTLLERILATDNVLLETAGGDPVWSHDVAMAALQGRVVVGSRD